MAAPSLVPLLADLFRDLAIAWRALAAYPSGHPHAAAGLAKASGSLRALLAESGAFELAAARDALLLGEDRFDVAGAAKLAELLRRRRAASVVFEPGADARELELFLRALALDERHARDAGPLAAELAAAGLVHIRCRDLDFSDVALVDSEAAATAPEAGRLWERLVRHVLAAGGLPETLLSRWLGENRTAFDLLRSLLEGDAPQGDEPWGVTAADGVLGATAALLLEAPEGGAVESVATLYRGLGAVGRARLGGALAAQAAHLPDAARRLAPLLSALPEAEAAALRAALAANQGAMPAPRGIDRDRLARLRRAFAVADLDAFRDERPPERALEVLLELPAGGVRPQLPAAAVEFAGELEAGRLPRASALVLLELAEREEVDPARLPAILLRLEAGYRALLAAGRVRQALDLAERVLRQARGEGPAAALFRGSARRLAGRESMTALCAGLPELGEEGAALVRSLVGRLGEEAAQQLLGLLAEADDRQLRHRLLDLLAALGPLAVRQATHLLGDARWYVVRNMLLLLRRVGDPGSVPAVRRCADHPDLRVRLEAIRNLFAFDQELPRELLRKALTHPNPRLAEAAVDLAGEHGLLEAAEPLADLVARWDPFGARRALRLKAIRALGALAAPDTLSRLRRFSRRVALPPVAREERIALYRSLAAYPAAARRDWVERGLRSPIDEIRRLSVALVDAAEEAP